MKLSKIIPALKYFWTYMSRTNTITKLYKKEGWHDCISACNEALKHDQKDFFSFYYRGLSKMELNMNDETISDFEKALLNLENNRFQNAMKGYELDANYRIALTLKKQRKFDDALNQINLILEHNPKFASGNKLKAYIYEEMEQFENALKAIQMSLQFQPNNTELLDHKNHISQLIMYKKSV